MKTRNLLPLLFTLLAACGETSESEKAAAGATASLPASLKLDAAPAVAKGVAEVRQSATEGSEVVVTGKVKDFLGDRAGFTIADLTLSSCEGMECKTPWDYCCEEQTKLTAGTAMIEVRDGAELAKGTAKGWNGLDHLKTVTVRGKVAKDAQGNVTVIATGIHVQS